jgi:hypothetical protein
MSKPEQAELREKPKAAYVILLERLINELVNNDDYEVKQLLNDVRYLNASFELELLKARIDELYESINFAIDHCGMSEDDMFIKNTRAHISTLKSKQEKESR